MPFSMIVVETRTSYLRSTKSIIRFSRTGPAIWPWTATTRAWGTSLVTSSATLSMSSMRLWMTVDLAAPAELLADGRGDELGVEGRHDRVDGQPVARRRLDEADVAQARRATC